VSRKLLGSAAVAQRLFLQQTLPRERALRRRMTQEFRAVAAMAAAQVARGNDVETGLAQGHDTRVERLLRATYYEGMQAAANVVFRAAGVKAAKPRDRFEGLVKRWIEDVSLAKVRQIGGTTRQQLRNVVARGREEGLGPSGIARMLRDEVGDTLGRARALTIARTETHSAANAAQLYAAEALEIPNMRREWIAANDERTRDDHADANGQVVGLDEPFEVGGALLNYPGDAAGPPEQIINCRCTTGFIVPD
jgi:SPP1 gp7 family putative phage head morphogenesis protein